MRFYYLIKTSHGARIHKPTFGTSTTGRPRLNLLRIEEELSAAHLRLQRVLIERLPYQDFIKRYDRPHTLFYLDPPYYGCEDYYGKAIFSSEDFGLLSEQLGKIAGRFVLSINDVPKIREIFGAFELTEVTTSYSVGGGSKQKPANELLVSNYKL